MSERADGNCFEVAAHIMLAARDADALAAVAQLEQLLAEDVRLVHGMVTRPTDGKVHAHAWVEAKTLGTTFCFDYANGSHVVLPRDYYYQLGKIENVATYTVQEMQDRMVHYMHYGPWDLDWETDDE